MPDMYVVDDDHQWALLFVGSIMVDSTMLLSSREDNALLDYYLILVQSRKAASSSLHWIAWRGSKDPYHLT
jgi:hypothetical protein